MNEDSAERSSWELDLPSVCDGNTMKLITSQAQAQGVPRDYVFFSMLSGVASCIGTSYVEINEEWKEKCAIWCAVVARQGSRRTPILQKLEDVMLQLREADDVTESVNVVSDECGKQELQILKDKANSYKVLGLFENLDEILAISNLEKYELKSATLKRTYDSAGASRPSATSMSTFGFVVPDKAKQIVAMGSRLLISCPPPVFPYAKDLKTPMPSNTPPFDKVLEVLLKVHKTRQTYVLTPEARVMLNQYYDRVQECLQEIGDHDQKFAMLSKAPGQLMRVGASLSAWRQALKSVVYREDITDETWKFQLSPDDIESAKILMDHVIATKVNILDGDRSWLMAYPQMGEPPMKRQRLSMAADLHAMQMAEWARVRGPRDRSNGNTVLVSSNPGGDADSSRSTPTNGSSSFQSSSRAELEPGNNGTLSWSQLPETSDHTPGNHNFSSISGVIDRSEFWNHFPSEDEEFITETAGRLKKFLEFNFDFRIAPSTCAQRHLIPPLSRQEMERYDTQTKYPVIIAKEFLVRVAQLGYGFVQNVTNSSTKRRSCYFEKYPYEKLSSKAKDTLHRLHVKEADYSAAFQPYTTSIPYVGLTFASSSWRTAAPGTLPVAPPSASTGVGPPLFPEKEVISNDQESLVKQEKTDA